MAIRRPAARGNRQGTRVAPAKPARKPAVPQAKRRDVTEYAVKVPTPYHKIFAKWIVEEVGYNPDEARSLRAAFLKGVSIATAARPAFNSSDYIEEWRERTGETKRGPKPKDEEAAPAARRRKPAPEPEPEEDEDEFDDESDELDDDSEEDDEDADEFDDEDVDDDSDEDEFDEEEEEAPAPKKRPVPQRGAAKSAARSAPARKAVPAKRAPVKGSGSRVSKGAADDDDFLF